MIKRLLITACCVFIPVHAMVEQRKPFKKQQLSMNNSRTKRAICTLAVADLIDLHEPKKMYSIEKRYLIQTKSDLNKIPSFQSLKISPFIMKLFLKTLVINGEAELLSPFLALYERSYPNGAEGINFTYTLDASQNKEPISASPSRARSSRENHPETFYTLYDAAEVTFLDLRTANRSTNRAEKVLKILIHHGADTHKNIMSGK